MNCYTEPYGRLASCYIKSIETSSCAPLVLNEYGQKALVTAIAAAANVVVKRSSMYPRQRRARCRQASPAMDRRRRAVPHLFRPLKREKNRGIYDRAASRQEGN